MFSKKKKEKRREFVPDFKVAWSPKGYYAQIGYFNEATHYFETKAEVVQHIYQMAYERHVEHMINRVEGYSYE